MTHDDALLQAIMPLTASEIRVGGRIVVIRDGRSSGRHRRKEVWEPIGKRRRPGSPGDVGWAGSSLSQGPIMMTEAAATNSHRRL
jgi:hypothetical protein